MKIVQNKEIITGVIITIFIAGVTFYIYKENKKLKSKLEELTNSVEYLNSEVENQKKLIIKLNKQLKTNKANKTTKQNKSTSTSSSTIPQFKTSKSLPIRVPAPSFIINNPINQALNTFEEIFEENHKTGHVTIDEIDEIDEDNDIDGETHTETNDEIDEDNDIENDSVNSETFIIDDDDKNDLHTENTDVNLDDELANELKDLE